MKSIMYILAALSLALHPVTTPAATITGRVVDLENQPVIGASVIIMSGGMAFNGTATNTDGGFSLKLVGDSSIVLRISALGFAPDSLLLATSQTTPITIQLQPRSVDVGQIDVRPEPDNATLATHIDKTTVDRRARNSLIPTNPVAGIKSAQTVRQGSQHSSKIRVNGTNPEYRLNRLSIGHDPTHYGVFSLLASSVVDRAELQANRGDASATSPAELDLYSIRPFGEQLHGEMSMSLTDLTGMTAYGSENAFILGSLRKSVLDKLIRYLDVHAKRTTLPPTNFQDVFASAGFRPSSSNRILIDHYDSRDHLSYTYQSSGLSSDDRFTSQSTTRRFSGLSVEQMFTNMLITASISRRTTDEDYTVLPSAGDPNSLHVGLNLQEVIWSGGVDVDLDLGATALTGGMSIERTTDRSIDLSHRHWNFKPPDAVSDNPYIYQQQLNETYGQYQGATAPSQMAAYVSANRKFGWLELTSGIRYQQFSDLADKSALVLRQEIDVEPFDGHTFSAYVGTFAEHPYTTVLEPYQVMIHDQSAELSFVRTTALSFSWQHRWLTAGVHAKTISNLPTPVPDFSKSPDDPSFIRMQSSEEAEFYGFDLTVDKKSLWPNVDLYAYYGYTLGRTSIPDGSGGMLTIPHDMTSPHRMLIETTYRPSSIVSLGAELGIRSGYSYTPHYTSSDFQVTGRYSPEYYRDEMSRMHSRRFPTSASLNLHMGLHFDQTMLFFNVANVTNQANPIVNTLDGYVYDAGILPTVGLKHRF